MYQPRLCGNLPPKSFPNCPSQVTNVTNSTFNATLAITEPGHVYCVVLNLPQDRTLDYYNSL